MVIKIFLLLFFLTVNLYANPIGDFEKNDLYPNQYHLLKGDIENLLSQKSSEAFEKNLFSNHPRQILLFADSLFKEGDYYRAITEYKRAHFYFPTYEKKDLILYMIGKCYYLGGKYRSALNYLAPLTNMPNQNIRLDIKNLVGLSYLYRKDYIGAERIFKEIISEFEQIPNLDTYHILISMSLVNRQMFTQGKKSFAEFLKKFPDSKFKELAVTGLKETGMALDFSPRIPWLATSLSILLPGAGQLYNREYSNAFVALVFNLTLGFLAVRGFLKEDYVSGGIFTSLFITFYSGNIYQAYRSAIKFNKTFLDERQEKINHAFEKYKLTKEED
jgi:tetratricopeptide (TPR) repeat protein